MSYRIIILDSYAFWICRISNIFNNTLVVMEQSSPIGGPGISVEIDESKFGKRKYHKGHAVEGQWVFGGREKNDKSKVFMIPVDNRKQETLIPLIQK